MSNNFESIKKIQFLHYYSLHKLCKKFQSTLFQPMEFSARLLVSQIRLSFRKLQIPHIKKLQIPISKISEFFKITDFQSASFRFASYSKPNATLKRNVTKQIVPIIILGDNCVHVIINHNTYWARVIQMTAVWYQVSKPFLFRHVLAFISKVVCLCFRMICFLRDHILIVFTGMLSPRFHTYIP